MFPLFLHQLTHGGGGGAVQVCGATTPAWTERMTVREGEMLLERMKLWHASLPLKQRTEKACTCFAHGVGGTLLKDGVRLNGLRPLSPLPSVLPPPLIPRSSLLFRSHVDLFLQPGEESDMMLNTNSTI